PPTEFLPFDTPLHTPPRLRSGRRPQTCGFHRQVTQDPLSLPRPEGDGDCVPAPLLPDSPSHPGTRRRSLIPPKMRWFTRKPLLRGEEDSGGSPTRALLRLGGDRPRSGNARLSAP